MSNHQKRLSAPVSWPVERKTATFTVKAEGPHGDDGVPLVILLRDVLEYVDTTKEASYAVNAGGVLVNGEPASDPRRPIGMFDILAFPDRSEHYRVFPDEGGRLGLTPIDADAADSKLGKVVDKTVVTGGRVQLNLHDGTNLLVDDHEVAAGDSVVVENDDKSVVAHFPYEEGALVTAVDGQHAGEVGVLAAIEVTPGSSSNTVRVETDDGEFETVEEYVVVIDEKFVDDEPALEEDEEAAEDEVEPEADESGDDESEAEDSEDAEPEDDDGSEDDEFEDDESEDEAESEDDEESEDDDGSEDDTEAEDDESEAEEAEDDDSEDDSEDGGDD